MVWETTMASGFEIATQPQGSGWQGLRYWPFALVVLVLGGMSTGLAQSATGVAMGSLQSAMGFGDTGASWVGGIYSLIQGVIGFIGAGWLSDRIGDRKKVMVPTLLGFGALAMLSSAAPNLPVLLLLRAAMGLMAGGWVSLMVVYGTECAPSRWRPFASGVTLGGLTAGLGVIAPRLVPHLIAAIGWRSMILVVGAPPVLVAALAAVVLAPGMGRLTAGAPEAGSLLRVGEAFRRRNVVLGMFSAALAFSILAMLTNFGHEFLTEKGLSLADAGNALSGWGIGGIVGAVCVPAIGGIIGRRTCLCGAAVLGAVFMAMFAYASEPGLTFWSLALLGFCVQGIIPLLILIAAESVEDRLRGKAVGLVNLGLNSLGGGVIAISLGSIAGHIGLQDTFETGTLCCLAAAVLAVFMNSRPLRIVTASVNGDGSGPVAGRTLSPLTAEDPEQ
jgi:MFS family permease